MKYVFAGAALFFSIAGFACAQTQHSFVGGGGTSTSSTTSSAAGGATGGTGGDTGSTSTDTSSTSSSSTTKPECAAPSDCPATATQCVLPNCIAGQCTTKVEPDGAPCADSGGHVCSKAVCVACLTDGDCSPGNTCTAARTCVGQCTNGLRDGNESDIDCGGGSCAPCDTGKKCYVTNDCVAGDECQNGVCVACAAGYASACGSCGGTVRCDGSCSVPTPSNFGTKCGACGTIQCDGSCSPADPTGYGTACADCGGTIQCDGSCFPLDPKNYGLACGSLKCTCGYSVPKAYDCFGHCVATDVCSCCGSFPC